MKKTAQFGLNQWEMSDRIQMDDFNRDNAAIEAALAARNCQFYTTSYIGDGETTKTWTFPGKPILVMMVCPNGLTVLIRGATVGCTYIASNHYQFPAGDWTDNSITVTYDSSSMIANGPKDPYGLFAILEAE